MFDDDMDDEQKQRLTLEWDARFNDENNYIRRSKNVGETYMDVLDEVVWFLQSIGFTYIHGLTALGKDGKELSTSFHG